MLHGTQLAQHGQDAHEEVPTQEKALLALAWTAEGLMLKSMKHAWLLARSSRKGTIHMDRFYN